jgi:predicted dehydrogenase
MRIGIVGAGFMGTTHAEAWAQTPAQIVGFTAETIEEALPLAKKYSVQAFADFSSLLEAVDVVDLCTPTHLHVPMILEAAAKGKHIICEKPLALSPESAQQAVQACQQAGVTLFVAHVVRYFPEYALAKRLVDEGQIGKVATLRLLRGSYRPKKPVGNWFLDESKSGGILLDLMIHDIDYARWVAGEVESVFARKVSMVHQESPIDYGLIILKHTSGAISHIAGAWAYPPPTFRTQFEINGDRGMIEFDSQLSSPIQSLILRPNQEAPDVGIPSSPVQESPYTTEIKEFYAALIGERPSRVTAKDGVEAVRIATAAVQSAKSGEVVNLLHRKEDRS